MPGTTAPFADLEVFTRVVELGGFTKAAANLRLTASGVSRIITRMEERLGVRLLNRTTRSQSLTEEGADYYERCTRILAELHEANAAVTRARGAPRGRLRVDLPIVFADFLVGPAMPRFLARYPELELDLSVRDRLIDPTAEGVDVVLRLAPPRDSDLLSRRLGPARSLLVASPKYLARRGRPRSLSDLSAHDCVPYLLESGPLPWRFKTAEGEVTLPVKGRLQAASGNLLTRAAVAGLGLAQTYQLHITRELARRELVPVLTDLEPEPRVAQALFARQKADLPRVRVFIDFLVELFARKER